MEPKSIQSELFDIVSQMASIATNPQPPADPASAASQGAPAAPAAPASETPKVEAPAAPTAPVATPPAEPTPAIDLNAVVDNWDVETPSATPAAPAAQAAPVAVPNTSSLDLSEIAKVLGKETIQTKEEALKEVQERLKAADLVSKLPQNLSKAIEIAALGGNYLEYLGVSQVDWAKEDPIVLYENYVLDQFTAADGTVDFEKADKILDRIEDDEKELRGRELQKQYVNFQAQQKAIYENQARAQRQNFEQTVRQTVDKMGDIAGFKLSPSKKEELYNYVVSGKDLEQTNVQTRLTNAFITKYWDTLDNFRKTQIKNLTKKQILDEVTVPNISTVDSGAQPTPPKKEGFSFDDYIASLNPKR